MILPTVHSANTIALTGGKEPPRLCSAKMHWFIAMEIHNTTLKFQFKFNLHQKMEISIQVQVSTETMNITALNYTSFLAIEVHWTLRTKLK
jgi:hypothetical protein